ncbi:MAG: GNAT family N-acetyltransferase [Candidatus Latescibacteria bacterium]|nr:GNAT family N-acetyltransferase [Candidatus Latescibacterota bacterium]
MPKEYHSTNPPASIQPLIGERIFLRDYQLADLNAVHAWLADAETMKYLGTGHTRSLEETLVRFAACIEHKLAAERTSWNLALVLKETAEVVGQIGLFYRHRKFDGGEGGLGWFLRKDMWRQGLASEGARLAVDFGFRTLQMDKISASCIAGNTASERIMQKLGMTKEAEYRESSVRFGQRVNRLGYAILRSEWQA